MDVQDRRRTSRGRQTRPANEVFGLSWSDLDWDAGRIKLHQQARRKADGGGAELAPLKRTDSARILPVPDVVLRRLRLYYQQRTVGPDLIFPNRDGRPRSGNEANVWFRRLARQAGLPPGRTPHTLRHGVASELMALGIPDRLRADILGHKEIRITNAIYTHTTPEQVKAALDALADRLSEAT